MKLIIFATLAEAHHSLSSLKAKQRSENLYAYAGGKILICGMGPASAQKALPPHLEGVTEIYNYGVAGALNTSLPRFSVHTIATVHMDEQAPLHIAQSGKRLLSVTQPLYYQPNTKSLLQNSLSGKKFDDSGDDSHGESNLEQSDILQRVGDCSKIESALKSANFSRNGVLQEALNADLVDMEGYTIATIAHNFHISCSLIKIVSDYCTSTSKEEIMKSLPIASQKIAELL